MAQLTGIARIGRDAEVRFTQGGDAVASLSLAFSYGRKGQDGRKPTQWVDASLWGERATKLAEYLLKGTLVYVVLDDVHIETFKTRDNTEGTKLAGRVATLEFAAKPADQQQAAPAPRQAPPRPAAPAAPASGSLADMDDDIPFACLGAGRAWAVI